MREWKTPALLLLLLTLSALNAGREYAAPTPPGPSLARALEEKNAPRTPSPEAPASYASGMSRR